MSSQFLGWVKNLRCWGGTLNEITTCVLFVLSVQIGFLTKKSDLTFSTFGKQLQVLGKDTEQDDNLCTVHFECADWSPDKTSDLTISALGKELQVLV